MAKLLKIILFPIVFLPLCSCNQNQKWNGPGGVKIDDLGETVVLSDSSTIRIDKVHREDAYLILSGVSMSLNSDTIMPRLYMRDYGYCSYYSKETTDTYKTGYQGELKFVFELNNQIMKEIYEGKGISLELFWCDFGLPPKITETFEKPEDGFKCYCQFLFDS